MPCEVNTKDINVLKILRDHPHTHIYAISVKLSDWAPHYYDILAKLTRMNLASYKVNPDYPATSKIKRYYSITGSGLKFLSALKK